MTSRSTVRAVLIHVQNDLFDVGADFCTPVVAEPGVPAAADHPGLRRPARGLVRRVQRRPAERCGRSSCPAARPAAAQLHVARTVVRRAERVGVGGVRRARRDHEQARRSATSTGSPTWSSSWPATPTASSGDVLWVPGGERGRSEATRERPTDRLDRRRGRRPRSPTRRRPRHHPPHAADRGRRARLHRPHRPGRAARGGGQGRRLQGLEGPRRDVGDGVHARRRRRHRPARSPSSSTAARAPSSIWLHMGLLGPRRVDLGDVTAPHPPPYRLVDNPETLLAVSDLVFIDPMSTGHTPRRRGRQGQGLPRLRQGRRAGHRADPAVVHPRGPLDVAEVRHRRVLRHRPRRRGRRAALDAPLDGAERAGAGLQRARLRQPGLRASTAPTRPASTSCRPTPRSRTTTASSRAGSTKLRQEAEAFAAGPYRHGARAPGAGCRPRSAPSVVRTLARLTGLSRGVRRPHRPADRALALLHRAAARPRPDRRPDRRPLHRPAALADRREHGRRPVDGRDGGAVHRGPAPLPARRARQHPGPPLRGVRQRDQGVVVQGVRGQADLRRRQAGAGDAGQPAPAGADRVRLLRPRHAVPRGGGHGRPPAAARRGLRPDRARVLRDRPHALPARGVAQARGRRRSPPSSSGADGGPPALARSRWSRPPDAVSVFTDGACSGNPGPGGWAWAVDRTTYASGARARPAPTSGWRSAPPSRRSPPSSGRCSW